MVQKVQRWFGEQFCGKKWLCEFRSRGGEMAERHLARVLRLCPVTGRVAVSFPSTMWSEPKPAKGNAHKLASGRFDYSCRIETVAASSVAASFPPASGLSSSQPSASFHRLVRSTDSNELTHPLSSVVLWRKLPIHKVGIAGAGIQQLPTK